MKNLNEIIQLLGGVKGCVEQLRVSGKNDCAIIIASCNTLDDIVSQLREEENKE